MTGRSIHEPAPEQARAQRSERGMTLIELMIAMLISSILVGFILGIYTRMSTAYRSQTSVSEVQQRLRLAKELIVRDMRPVGNLLPRGFNVLPGLDAVSPLDLRNPVPPILTLTGGGSTPDSIHIFYADTTISTTITDDVPPTSTSVSVTDASRFSGSVRFQRGNKLAVILRPYDIPSPPGGTGYRACVVRITSVGVNQLTFDSTGAPFNSATNTHCDFPDPPPGGPIASIIAPGSLVYAFAARAYRIDSLRPRAGVLQRSMTGGMENDWVDIGVGFTDLQVTRRYFESGDIDDADSDLDPTLDWFSGVDPPPVGVTPPTPDAKLTEIGIGITARTIRNIDGPGPTTTPSLLQGDPNHNSLGDSPAITLDGVPVAARPLPHQGNYTYRWTTVRIDIRNLMEDRTFFLDRL